MPIYLDISIHLKMSLKRYIHCISITDSGVESSATNIGFESAISDNEHPPANIDDEGSPAPAPPSLEDAMQRLAETIKEFDSHAMTDQDEEKSTADEGQKTTNGEEQQKEDEAEKQPQNKQNLSQGQISIFFTFLYSFASIVWLQKSRTQYQ